MTIKKLIGGIHLWLGLLSGLVIFILGITGCLYCFADDLKEVFYEGRIKVDKQGTSVLPLDSLNAIAQKALGADKPLKSVTVNADKERTYAYLAYQYNADANTYASQLPYFITVYINPYTGKVQCVEDTKHEFFRMVLALHYDLMLGKTGQQIVSWSCAVFVVMLITGIVLWWPRNKAAARQRFWFRWKKSTRWKRKNYDLHNVPGFYSLLPALLLALTGLVFGFEWFSSGVKKIANGGKEFAVSKPVFSDTTSVASASPYAEVLNYVKKEEPAAQRLLVLFPFGKTGAINVLTYPDAEQYSGANSLFFDQYSGKWLSTQAYAKQPAGEKLIAANYDIHVGKILDFSGEVLAFLASFIAASLPVTGFLIWWGRKKKAKRKNIVNASGNASCKPLPVG